VAVQISQGVIHSSSSSSSSVIIIISIIILNHHHLFQHSSIFIISIISIIILIIIIVVVIIIIIRSHFHSSRLPREAFWLPKRCGITMMNDNDDNDDEDLRSGIRMDGEDFRKRFVPCFLDRRHRDIHIHTPHPIHKHQWHEWVLKIQLNNAGEPTIAWIKLGMNFFPSCRCMRGSDSEACSANASPRAADGPLQLPP
jgi:hypothetical protein